MSQDNFLDFSDNIKCYIQGYTPNGYMTCSPTDTKYIIKLINLLILYPNTVQKLQYTNVKDDLSFIEGKLLLKENSKIDYNVISNIKMEYYNDNKNFKRNIVIVKLPDHNGYNN